MTSPRNLTANGLVDPIGVDERPLLAWDPAGPVDHEAFQLEVHDTAGSTLWRASVGSEAPPERRYDGPPLRGRTSYRWRVRTIEGSGSTSGWSGAQFETGILDAADWSAQWIGRPTPAAQRPLRSPAPDDIQWIRAGETLEQTFTTSGLTTAVSLDLTSPYGEDVIARAELLAGDRVVAAQDLQGGVFPWDRFAHYIEAPEPLSPGTYRVVISVTVGSVGWRTARAAPPADARMDDGLSPLPVVGHALRDGVVTEETRSLAVEPVPAPNPVFRHRFELADGFSRARLHSVGLGYGTFTLNGRVVGEHTLDPAQTAYDHTVLYRTVDVTHLLHVGTNEIRAELGRGFFALRGGNVWGWNLSPWNQEPVLIAQLELLDAAGSRQVIASGPDWQTAPGEISSDLLFVGEEHHLGSGPDVEWRPVTVTRGPGGTLRPAQHPPVTPGAAIAPVATHARGGGVHVFDFGSIVAGRVRASITGAQGAIVELKYGEYLSPQGDVVCENVLAAGDAQRDRIVLAAPAKAVEWEARFSYKGFRFVEVRTHGGAQVADVVAIPLRTDVRPVGELALSEPTLEWINQATGRTFLNNLHGIPTDTPVYEKNGWTADAHLVTGAALHHFDLRQSMLKWLDDHVDAQDEEGMVPQIVPTPGWGLGADPAWSASMVLIPWDLYREYGETEILARYADPIGAYSRRLLDLCGPGVWPHHSWGDWLAPGHMFAPEGAAPTATMMTYRVAMRAAAIMQVLQREAEAQELEGRAALVARAYHDAYFDPGTGSYGVAGVGYRQTMNILPLAFGAVPPEHVETVFGGLVRDLETRTSGHLDCGAAGVKHLPEVLSDHGRADLAITVLAQKTRPGWGVWRDQGSQTLRESWDVDARSHDHYFLGSVSAWIQEHAAGVRATSAGWATFDVDPVVDPRLTSATFAHRTTRGWVRVRWTHDDGRVWIGLTVPRGARARVTWDGRELGTAGPGTHSFSAEVADRPSPTAADDGASPAELSR